MLLLILAAILYPERFSVARLIGIFTCFAVVLNSKLQLEPVALAALGVFLVVFWISRRRYALLSVFIENGGMWHKFGVSAALAAFLALSFANAVKN